MSGYSSHQAVPSRPYLGLDYFREEDAYLFTERGKEIRDCASMLLSLNVKIFVLQGSTGAGKSSFLRAGLIPRLRSSDEYATHFLSDGDCVIRCTADPLKWIATALAGAIRSNRFDLDELPADCPDLEALSDGPRTVLADAILSTMHMVCQRLPGHLVLVLDQAEEVLTKANGETGLDESAKAFFYFLEEAYLRNIDVRIIVALRTEYYGRFRDELCIEDDRLTQRPHSGGVEPFLLRPLRDPNALARIIAAPTTVNEGKAFNFRFDPDAIERIVKDLLAYFTHGSVTPFLQVICAILYERLTPVDREISLSDYLELGDIRGIAQLYLERGISHALGPGASAEQKQKWLLLLHLLVSGQGGGTVVSEIESLATLKDRARERELDGDVERVLLRLCEGNAPLLRGLPIDKPAHFSLKHDVLAVVLVRWKVMYTTTQKDQLLRRQRSRKLFYGWSVCAAVVLAACAWLLVARVQQSATEAAIESRLRYALNPPRSDFGQSLLLLVDSINAIEKKAGFIPFGDSGLLEKATEQLRSTILRSPRYSGQYRAVGFDSAGREILLLPEDGLCVKHLSIARKYFDRGLDLPRELKLPPEAAAGMRSKANVAVGFIDGLGPAAFIDGKLYHWTPGNAEAEVIALTPKLPGVIVEGHYSRYEIVNGAMQITANYVTGKGTRVVGIRLTSDALRAEKITDTSVELATIEVIAPPPLFSDSTAMANAYAYVSRSSPDDKAAPVKLMIGRSGEESKAFAIPEPTQAKPEADENIRFAFVTGEEAAVLQRDKVGFQYLDLRHPARDSQTPVAIQFESGHGDSRHAPQPMTSYTPFVSSPLAGVRKDGKLTIAWIAIGGVVMAEWTGGESGSAPQFAGHSNMSTPMLSGEPKGSKLQFSEDGQLLLLQQAPFYNAPMRVRIWDISSERKDFIAKQSVSELIKVACGIVHDRQEKLPDPDQSSVELLRIAGRDNTACPTPEGKRK